jgi:pyruvate,orthophosphate dikinase
VGDHTLREGDAISIDGTSGEVMAGSLTTRPSEIVQVLVERSLDEKDSPTCRRFATLMGWADEVRRLRVRTNADTPADSTNAVAFGAEGIGLCRTEHMFFETSRIAAVREMIIAESSEGRRKALAKILPMQREDFIGIFRVMRGRPVTIRTLDPPLHEFLPHSGEEIADLAKTMGLSVDRVTALVESHREMNPMLGLRGCRLGIMVPEITEMQARAIFEAAVVVVKEGIPVVPEVMIPLVAHANELRVQREIVERVANEVLTAANMKLDYLVGTMIELPRAALTADQLAQHADFFSFGTNDLTQTTYGFSRDDAGRFLPEYVRLRLFPDDPFVTVDPDGVGALVRMACEKGRQARSTIKLGICGEHGGEARSVVFCHDAGLDYVSCSPFRIPVARLAAAQAALR